MKKIKDIFYYSLLFIIALTIICFNINNGILLSLISILFIFLFVKKVKIKNFSLFIIIFCLITKLIAIFIIKTPLNGDFILMYDTAKHIASEGFNYKVHDYFNTWGYQLFHVFYEAIIIKLFNSITILKILNVIYSTIITYLIYKISRKLTNEESAKIVSLIYSIALYPIYLNTILGNHQLSLMLALIGIYLLLFKENNYKYMIIIGLLFAFSHLERNEGIIYLLTTIIYFILNKKSLKKLLVLVITFFLTINIISYSFKLSGINDIGLDNKNTEWKFLLGFNTKTNGVYDVNDEIYLNDLNKEHSEVINRITNIKALPNLFYNKIKIQFLYDNFGASFNDVNKSDTISNLKEIIFNYIRIMNLFIYLLVFIGLLKNKKINNYFIINFILLFGAFMLIEIAPRYYFNPQVTLFILSSYGVEYLLKTKYIKKYFKTQA